MEIRWSNEALISRQKAIESILLKWDFDIVERFEKELNATLNRIKENNYCCPKSNKFTNLRKCVISKHNSLIYEIRNNLIEIHLITINKMDHTFY